MTAKKNNYVNNAKPSSKARDTKIGFEIKVRIYGKDKDFAYSGNNPQTDAYVLFPMVSGIC